MRAVNLNPGEARLLGGRSGTGKRLDARVHLVARHLTWRRKDTGALEEVDRISG